MYKISWAKKSDKFSIKFILVPDVHTLFDIYHIITGYGRKDGCVPIDIKVTNLNGEVIDMSKGLNHVAGYGSY